MSLQPCKRPKVTVDVARHDVLGRPEAWEATCSVLDCTWPGYGPGVKTDVEQNAVRHRQEHRALVPTVAVIRSHGAEPWHVECSCGFIRHDGTTTTRTDADGVRDRHLINEHGLVS